MFHISSPIEGWDGRKPERHHDFIDVKDFPNCWRRKKITVEVEAKAKEAAVLKLKNELETAQEGSSQNLNGQLPGRAGDGLLNCLSNSHRAN